MLGGVVTQWPAGLISDRVDRRLVVAFLAFLALVACMLRPTFVATRKARQQGTVVVLADASESMTVADGPAGRTRWRPMAGGPRPRPGRNGVGREGPGLARLSQTGRSPSPPPQHRRVRRQ
jgi:hypothetical protein